MPYTPEELLEHAGWMRRLARAMLDDEHLADDAVQESLLTALRRPPKRSGHVRGWLATVLRNVVRQQARRDARYRDVVESLPEPPPFPDPQELVERATAHRRVVDVVLSLDDPYRTALLAHYFQGMPASEIARRQGIAVLTVRTHIKRGVAKLRARLDRELGGSARCSAILLGLALPRMTAPVAMNAARAAAKASLLLGGAVGLGLWVASGVASRDAPRAEPQGERPIAAAPMADPSRPDRSTRIAEPRAPNAAPRTAPLRSRDAVSGVVRDAAGLPVAGASVRFIESNPPFECMPSVVRSVETDAQGGYRIDRLPRGVPVFLEAQGAGTFAVRRWAYTGMQVDFVVGAPGRLEARVLVAATGEHASDGVAALYSLADRARSDPERGAPAASARIGSGGVVTFLAVPPGPYALHVWPTDAAPRRFERVRVRAGATTDLTVHVHRGGRVLGRVIDARDGRPVEGAVITCRRMMRTCRTDAYGRFEFAGVLTEAEPLRLLVHHPAYAVQRVVSGCRFPRHDLGDVAIRSIGTIRGRVVDHDDRGLAGVTVSYPTWTRENNALCRLMLPPGTRRSCTTDADGWFELQTHPNLAREPLWIIADRAVPVSVAQASCGLVRLHGGRAVRGIVRSPDGEPCGPCLVSVWRDELPVATTWIDASARFAFHGVAPGRYRVEAVPLSALTECHDGLTLGSRDVAVGDVDQDVTVVVVRGVDYAGRVTDRAGRPIAGVDIRLAPSRRANLAGLPLADSATRTATSDERGAFRLTGLSPERTYRVTASAADYADEFVTVTPNEAPSTLVLDRLVTIEGRVVSSTGGDAVREFFIDLGRARSPFRPRRRHECDPQGRFELRVRAGRYRVRAGTHDGLLSSAAIAVCEVGAPAPSLTLTVAAANVLAGHVRFDGEPGGTGPVMAFRMEKGRPVWAAMLPFDASGRFRRVGLEAGEYLLLANEARPPGRVALGHASLGPTTDRRVSLTMTRPAPLRVEVVDDRGHPVSGARVVLRDGFGGAVPDLVLRRHWAETDAAGCAPSRRAPPGAYELCVTADGHGDVTQSVVLTPGVPAAVRVTVTRAR